MNLKIVKKIIITLLIIILGIVLFEKNVCYAEYKPNLDSETGGGVITPAEKEKHKDADKIYNDQEYYKPDTEEIPEKMNQIVGIILGAIRTIGIVLSVICLMIIGIKFMIGSVEQRAEYKKVMPGYILGVILIGAMSLIPSIIYDITSKWN